MIASHTPPLVFGSRELDTVTAAARSSPRRRKNLNFHADDGHPAHRLLNAVEPESYVCPHRHLAPNKDETLVVLRGAFGIAFFDEEGMVTDRVVIRAGGEHIGVNIPRGVFHTLVALESGSVFLEAKAGPYDAATDKELAPWAPPEGDAKAPAYHARLTALFQS
ncbi:MAG: WbuC family cupin fold metalloprotein [Rhodospirillaceae bacterium]